MNSNNESDDSTTMFQELMKKFSYSGSLLEHWLEEFGLDYMLKLIESLRTPMKTLWVQVNTNKIDFDSLLEIFYEHGFSAKKHELLDDFIEVDVIKRDLDTKRSDLPIVKVDHEASTGIALGKDVQTANVTKYDDFNVGDELCILDGASNLIAKGIADVNSSELSNLTQREVISVKESIAYAPPLTEMRIYRRGYFNILTPIQAIGVKSLPLGRRDSILVMSTDKGDVASYIAELTDNKIPITVLAQNDMQVKAIRKNLERAKSKAIRVHHASFNSFLRERHEIKYTAVFMEPQNSRTAIIPVFSSNLSYGVLRNYAEKQQKIVADLFRCLHKRASVAYITHSIDYLENEAVVKSITQKAYYKTINHAEEISKLKARDSLSAREVPEQFKEIKAQLQKATIYLDPITTSNSGGFLANFAFKEK